MRQALSSLTDGFPEDEKEILTEVSQSTLDLLRSKASGFDFFKNQSRNLKEALIACVLASKDQSLRFSDIDLHAAPLHELEVTHLPTNTVILTVRKK